MASAWQRYASWSDWAPSVFDDQSPRLHSARSLGQEGPFRFSRCYAAALCVVVVLQAAGTKAGDERVGDFLRQYASAAERLQDFYSRLQMTELQEGQYVKREHPSGRQTLKYLAAGSSLRVDRCDENGNTLSARVVTPEKAFAVARSSAKSLYHVEDIARSTRESALERIRITGPKLPFAPYCIFETRIVDFLSSDACTITDFVDVTREGRKLVQVFFDAAFERPNGSVVRPSGWFVFAPAECWALREYQWGAKEPSGTRLRCRLEYDQIVDGVPLISKARYWREQGDRVIPMYTILRTQVVMKPADRNNFALSAFGIPDVLGQRPTGGTGCRRWLVVANIAALIAFLIALSVLYWIRRSGHTASSGDGDD